jgi:two-component system nitrogen regulation sensor histidine kinase NtrY
MPRPIFKKIDIVKLITESLDFIKLTSKNSINLITTASYKFINGDEDQLNRVIINLIKNSEESFEELKQKEPNFKGNIDIEIGNNNDYIVIKVNDNGSGITDAKKAMTPYFTTKKTGTGLGLPIVTKIINEHNGVFLIKRKENNKGTTVTITLPKYV